MAPTGDPGVVRTMAYPAGSQQSPEFDTDGDVFVVTDQIDRLEGMIRPVGGVTPYDTTFEFAFPDIENTFLMMKHCALFAQCKIVTKANADPVDTDFSVVNNLGTALQAKVEPLINNFQISISSNVHNNFKSDIETDLSFNDLAAKTHLRTQLYFKDTAGQFDNFATQGDQKNQGYVKRQEVVSGGKSFQLYAPIVHDLFRANEHLRPGNKLTLKIHRISDEFLILTNSLDKGYKLIFEDIGIYFYRVRMDPSSVPRPLGRRLERYILPQTTLQKFPLPRKEADYIIIHPSGRFPRQIVFCMVETSAAEGRYDRNAFNYRHFGLNQCYLKVNSRSNPPDPFVPDFANKLCIREYANLFTQTASYRTDRSNLITFEDFCAGGYTYFVWDNSFDLCNGAQFHGKGEGEITLHLNWKTKPASEITVLVYMVFDAFLVKNSETGAFDLQVF